MASEYPMMLFGLPSAPLAIYLQAKTTKRKAIGGLLIDSFLGAFNAKNQHLLFLLVEPLTAVLYFVSFYYTIGRSF